jgi:hypothetical protein
MTETILIAMLILFIYIFLFFNRNKVVYMESITGDKMLIYTDSQKKEKANLLSAIKNNMYILRDHMYKNINNFPDYTDYIKQLNMNLDEDKTVIYETDPDTNLTSYSVNKGEELSFCLKSKKTGQVHDLNLLMYVAIHEMAHIACPEIGHGELFKKIFRKLIEEAINIGIYKKVDYNNNPIEYCGMILSSSII